MIVFRLIKRGKRNNLRCDGMVIKLCRVNLRDIGFRNFLLLGIRIKNRRTKLRTDIWTLSIPLRRILRNEKETNQKFAIGNLRAGYTTKHQPAVPETPPTTQPKRDMS